MQSAESSSAATGTLIKSLKGGPDWKEFVYFDGAPRVKSVFEINGASGHMELFAISGDSTLYHNWRDGDGWHGWEPNFIQAPKVTAVFGVPDESETTEM